MNDIDSAISAQDTLNWRGEGLSFCVCVRKVPYDTFPKFMDGSRLRGAIIAVCRYSTAWRVLGS